MGHNSLRKILQAEQKWTDKEAKRHKHSFTVHTIMQLRNMCNHIEYYDVLKCEHCNSFRSIPKEGSITGFITVDDYKKYYSHLPILKLYRSHKHTIGFDDMVLDIDQ